MTQDIPPLTSALPPAHGQANASALIHDGAGAYLLHLRDDIPGIWEPGAWSLLGGGREPGDRSLEETVRRELQEEAGLSIPHLAPFAEEEARASDGTSVPIHLFVGQWSGDPAALPLTEGVMLHWFRPETLPRLRMAQSTRDLIRRHAEMFPAATLSGAASSTTAATTAPAGRRTPRPHTLVRTDAGKAVLNVIGVHLYLENSDGEVLLGLRHPDSAYAGSTWHFLAGHCEQESAVACLVREAQEEAGLVIDPRDVEYAHAVHLVDTPGTPPRMQLVFRAHRWRGNPEIREPDKCSRWGWWHPQALPQPIVPYTRAAIDGIQAGRLYTERGWS
ncbi:NUDIX domain-containing protein [Streptomyces sp. NRRL S-1448]|uniref:NUDIX domain-containing protein n=1 Tax=Streptomyces sp. NRRL S-1448 TaxID=1463883 RepID=UPI0004BFD889|nr:NUDIX domain-containing protein [Streptomyces sp. NRRL S-1448]